MTCTSNIPVLFGTISKILECFRQAKHQPKKNEVKKMYSNNTKNVISNAYQGASALAQDENKKNMYVDVEETKRKKLILTKSTTTISN